LISFVADIPESNSKEINKLDDPYDKIKQSILKLGESHQQVVLYQSHYSHQQPFYNQINSPPIYGTNYSFTPRIGFESFMPQQQQQHHHHHPSYFVGGYQQMAIQRYGLNNNQPIAQTSIAPYGAPSTSVMGSSVKSIENPVIETPKRPQQQNFSRVINQKSDKNDLINLDVSDEATSFANILETFDPLISKHSINEEASNAYYSDQDPFDYIYNGNSHCSDPLYEAVSNRTENNYDLTPPPLPPRNSSYNDTPQQTYNDNVQYSKKLYENIVEKTVFDKDSLAFYNMVKELRSKYSFDDEKSNVGHIKVATLNSSYLNVSSIKVLVYPSYECFHNDRQPQLTRINSTENYQRLENYLSPLVFTCDTKSTVIHIIMQVLAMLENELQGLPENFVLKTIGSQEWLSDTNVTLSHLHYVQTSISLEKDIQFALYPRHAKHLKAIARTEIDDKRDRELKMENILPKDPVTSISYESLIILLETLEMEIEKVQAQSTNAPNTHISFNSSGVIQACRAICSLLGCIDTFELYHAVNGLKDTCDMQTSSSLQHKNLRQVDILSEKGNYAKVSLRPRSISEELKYRCDEIRDAVQHLLEVYTQAFQVNYTVNRPQWNISFINTSSVSQTVMLNLMAIHRPMYTWKYDEYMMGIQIFHGTRFIGEPVITQCSNSLAGFFPRLTFDTWLSFSDVPISILPREARIVFVLYGCMKQNPDGSTTSAESSMNNNASQQEVTKVELGWSAVQFFDYDREMIQGVYFLTIWPPSTDKYFCPSPQRATHPHGDYCPVLSVEIPSYGGRLRFPDIAPNSNVPKLDFYSLDTNLQGKKILNILKSLKTFLSLFRGTYRHYRRIKSI
jgi:phosphatidylinositol-4-phosphate 3-kinase